MSPGVSLFKYLINDWMMESSEGGAFCLTAILLNNYTPRPWGRMAARRMTSSPSELLTELETIQVTVTAQRGWGWAEGQVWSLSALWALTCPSQTVPLGVTFLRCAAPPAAAQPQGDAHKAPFTVSVDGCRFILHLTLFICSVTYSVNRWFKIQLWAKRVHWAILCVTDEQVSICTISIHDSIYSSFCLVSTLDMLLCDSPEEGSLPWCSSCFVLFPFCFIFQIQCLRIRTLSDSLTGPWPVYEDGQPTHIFSQSVLNSESCISLSSWQITN